MFTKIKAFFSAIVLFFGFLSSTIFGGGEAIKAKNPDECRVNFAVISDVHFNDEPDMRFQLKKGLYDMQKADKALDALIIPGDLTQHGSETEYENLAKAFKNMKPADEILFAIGNHDTRPSNYSGNDRYGDTVALFKKYNKIIADRVIEKTYYSTEINGYKFIVLGVDDDDWLPKIDAQQIAFLDRELADGTKDGKPVFVSSHYCIPHTHGIPGTWYAGDDTSDIPSGVLEVAGAYKDYQNTLLNTLKKYDNVFYITGHLHNGLAQNEKDNMTYPYDTYEVKDGIHCINLPVFSFKNKRGVSDKGQGLQFEVYDDSVIVRGRNYIDREWYPQYEFNIELQ